MLVVLLLLLVGGVFLLLRKMPREQGGLGSAASPSGAVQVIANPPQGISGVREETFNIINGFARSFDGDDSVGWKNARNVQVRGLVASWSGGALIVKLGGGTLALKVSDPVRYYCFPAVAPGADGGAAVRQSAF